MTTRNVMSTPISMFMRFSPCGSMRRRGSMNEAKSAPRAKLNACEITRFRRGRRRCALAGRPLFDLAGGDVRTQSAAHKGAAPAIQSHSCSAEHFVFLEPTHHL